MICNRIGCNNTLVKWQKKYCSKSCASMSNNIGKCRHGQTRYCSVCGKRLLSKKSYCSATCRQVIVNERQDSYIERWLKGEETGLTTSGKFLHHRVKAYILNKANYKCEFCGWSEVNPITNSVPVQIDHIDGDFQNCTENNLRVLCPNCHSLTPTYMSLNYGNGRKHRNKSMPL